jgi:hypothetical protein
VIGTAVAFTLAIELLFVSAFSRCRDVVVDLAWLCVFGIPLFVHLDFQQLIGFPIRTDRVRYAI